MMATIEVNNIMEDLKTMIKGEGGDKKSSNIIQIITLTTN